MNYYTELDKILSSPYLDDTFYDADVEYIMDILLPSLNKEDWKKLGDGLESKALSYKFKLAYCLDGYDDSKALILLMNLMLYSDGNVFEQVLRSLISFDLSKYRYLVYQFPQWINFLKQLASCDGNKVISRLSIDVFAKLES